MTAALFITLGLIWLICATALGERIPRPPRPIGVGDTVKVQARLHVFATGKVIREWGVGQTRFVEVAAPNGERYIRPVDNVERT